VDQPGIDDEIDHPIAATNSSKNQWQMPTTINLNSSGLSHATTMTNQNAHLHLASPKIVHLCSASPQSFTSARVPFSTICPLWWIVMYGLISFGKSSHYFIKELPAGLGLHSANSFLSASLDSHSTSITNCQQALACKQQIEI
jgi:hypothetical protein